MVASPLLQHQIFASSSSWGLEAKRERERENGWWLYLSNHLLSHFYIQVSWYLIFYSTILALLPHLPSSRSALLPTPYIQYSTNPIKYPNKLPTLFAIFTFFSIFLVQAIIKLLKKNFYWHLQVWNMWPLCQSLWASWLSPGWLLLVVFTNWTPSNWGTVLY